MKIVGDEFEMLGGCEHLRQKPIDVTKDFIVGHDHARL